MSNDGPQSQAQNPKTARSSETEERIAADRRLRRIRQHLDKPSARLASKDPQLINNAVAALCEAVRDYAIFIMNPEGIIVYWGMGAHLMKWWTEEEAVGAHLRLLYPEGGSEDGTAEDHLIESARTGEYVGEGQRIRRGGSTFWAHVVLTALRDPTGALLGFAKVTQDLTRRRAVESALALAHQAQTGKEEAQAKARAAQEALERAVEANLRAEEARQRADAAAVLAQGQASDAKHQITEVLLPALKAEQAASASLGAELDAYVQMFRESEKNEGPQE